MLKVLDSADDHKEHLRNSIDQQRTTNAKGYCLFFEMLCAMKRVSSPLPFPIKESNSEVGGQQHALGNCFLKSPAILSPRLPKTSTWSLSPSPALHPGERSEFPGEVLAEISDTRANTMKTGRTNQAGSAILNSLVHIPTC